MSLRAISVLRHVIVVSAVILAIPSAGSAQTHELLPNGSFDEDLFGWELPSEPDTTVAWQADGLPAGSLRIESSLVAPAGTGIFVRSPCIVLEHGAQYSRRADVRAESTPPGAGACNYDLFFYGEPDCSGPVTSNTFADAGPDGVWEEIAGGPTALYGVAVRVTLWMRRFPSDVSVCSFDNVSFLGPEPPSTLEVPTLPPIGLAGLAALLALAGAVALRRRTRRPSTAREDSA